MLFHRLPHAAGPTGVVPMAKHQLLAVFGGAALVVAVLLYGLGYTLVRSLELGVPGSTPASSTSDPLQRRDAIAAAPMAQVPNDAGMTPGVAISLPPATPLPSPTDVGASEVPTGYPHTPLGAAAQLAAIEVRVLTAMSLPVAVDVYHGWALPGGVGATDWSQTRNVASFLTHARQSSNVKDPGMRVSVTPVAIQIKGTDGPDWTVACVLDVRATSTADARMGYGTCERLQWVDGRWMIGPGTPPAAAPSTWPRSEASVKAGWQPLVSHPA